MRMAKVKDVKELEHFKDILEVQTVDGNTEAVTVKYNGKTLRITKYASYSEYLSLLVPEGEQEVKKYSVEGTYMDMQIVPKVFDNEFDANQYIIEMKGKLPYGEDHTLEVKEVVELQENTKI